MKLYKYTILKQDATKEVLAPCKKKEFAEFRKMLNCELIELIPSDYFTGQGWNMCTCYGDEEGRFNSNNKRNPHFKVLHNDLLSPGDDWDVVGDIIREEVYHG